MMDKEYLDKMVIEEAEVEGINSLNTRWWLICRYCKLAEQFIETYKGQVIWPLISEYQTLSEHFISKHWDLVDWTKICRYQKLSEKFIIENVSRIDWEAIILNDNIAFSEEFIRIFAKDYPDKIDWNLLLIKREVPDDIILEYRDKMDLKSIIEYQHLKEDTLVQLTEEITDASLWGEVSEFQHLSEAFMYVNVNRLDWSKVVKYQVLSAKFKSAIEADKLAKDDEEHFGWM